MCLVTITFSRLIHPVGSMFSQLLVRFSPVKGTAIKSNIQSPGRKNSSDKLLPLDYVFYPPSFKVEWYGTALQTNVFASFHQGRKYVAIIKGIKYHSVDNICSAMSSCEGQDPSFIITCSCYDYLVCPTLLYVRHLLELHRIEVSMHRY